MSQPTVGAAEVHRNRVVDAGADARIVQGRKHAVPFRDADDEQMPDVDVSFGAAGKDDAGQVTQQLPVAVRGPPPSFVPSCQPAQLGVEHHRLDGVEARVHADRVVLVLLFAAVGAKHPHPGRNVVVVRHHRSGVPGGTEVLARIEARAGHPSQRAGEAAIARGALGLGGVFDNDRSAGCRNRHQLLNKSRLTEQVDGDDGLGPGCHSRSHPAGIDQQVLRVDVDGHRHRTDPAHCLGGCDERVGREDDFPARCDP